VGVSVDHFGLVFVSFYLPQGYEMSKQLSNLIGKYYVFGFPNQAIIVFYHWDMKGL